VVGGFGWLWLLVSPPVTSSLWLILLFVGLALAIETSRLRLSTNDPHSMVGVVFLTALLTLGPSDAALIALIASLLFGWIQPLVYRRPWHAYSYIGRPFLRAGVRVIGLLLSYQLAIFIGGTPPNAFLLFLVALVIYPLVVQLNRVAREYVQGGAKSVRSWWRMSWRSILKAEILSLPAAWLAAAIYQQLHWSFFVLASGMLVVTSLLVRRASLSRQQQRRSFQELSVLNQVSRAIIRSSLDVQGLCSLIYQEASKLVDTSSFHLGLFEPGSDRYTLTVRVQDRVHLPELTVDLPTGDGIIGWMRETGRALLVHDFLREMDDLPARPRYQSASPPRSGIYVPLIASDTVIGSISIQSYIPNAFDTDDLRLLSLIADQAAIAISKARTFDEARQRAVQLQAIHEVSERITAILDLDELLQAVVQLIRIHFDYHPVHIFTLEDDGTLLFRASTEPETADKIGQMRIALGSGLVGAAARSSIPVLANDVEADQRYVLDTLDTRSELAVPLHFGEQTVGVLDLQSSDLNRFGPMDQFVMRTLGDQIAVAIQSARAFTAQREEAWTLNALLQVAENTAYAATLDDLLTAIVRLPPLLLGCNRCFCLLGELTEPPTFRALAAYGIGANGQEAFVGRTLSASDIPLLAEVRTSQAASVCCGDHGTARGILSEYGDGAMLALPLTTRGTLLGILIADYDDPNHQFAPRTLTLYHGIAGQVASALEGALLSKRAADARRLEEELRVAREIQTALLPPRAPHLPGWDLAADWRSARLVGGDFYDFWLLPQRSAPHEKDRSPLGFVIADVSDKGVPAAMFMTLSRSLVRAAALDGSAPEIALERANRWISRDSDSSMFVTLFYGVIDQISGQMEYSCAGHNPPLLLRASDDALLELSTHDIALGVLEDARLHGAHVTIHPGDVLVCYTDGITEAINADEEAFGVERLLTIVRAQRHASASQIVNAIVSELAAFTGDGDPFDDVTLVVIKREPVEEGSPLAAPEPTYEV
jgi:serine phosphatase RsbU (regulator of sigma subunit)/putative methionine-R-sulfoxide reductase with GAF domain